MQEKLLLYQLLSFDDIPDDTKELCNFGSKFEHPKRIDIPWGHLKDVKVKRTTQLQFDLLFRVVETVLTPMLEKNKSSHTFEKMTPSRSSLQLDRTLSSLVVLKTHIDNPVAWKPPQYVIEQAKKATRE